MTISIVSQQPGLLDRLTLTLSNLRACRLCWRITISIFAAILAAEAAILFFSIQRFEQDRLYELERESLVLTRAIIREAAHSDDFAAAVAAIGPRMRDNSVLLGIQVFDEAGRRLAGFGVLPDQVKDSDVGHAVTKYFRSDDGSVQDLIWPQRRTRSDYLVAARIDTGEIGPQVTAFIWRIIGLVMLISVVVTVVAMFVLERLLLNPLLQLRNGLSALSQDIENPARHRLSMSGKDELRDVTNSFDVLTARLESALLEIEQQNSRLRIKEVAEQANKNRSEFLSNMTHELRTPLNSVIGFSEVIKTQFTSETVDPQALEYVEEIYQGGHNLLGIINDILELTRIEAGSVSIQTEEICIGDIAQSCVNFFRTSIEDKQIEINLQQRETWGLVEADPQLIRQIILKVLSNAIKFSPSGSQVEISGLAEANGCLSIIVEDNGIGMSDEEILIALEPFGQVDGSLSRSNDGTGLGLPLVKLLLELHGGSLDIQSTKGAGTRVSMLLRPGAGNS